MTYEDSKNIRNNYNISLMATLLSFMLLLGASQTHSKIFVGVSLVANVLSGIWMARQKLNYYRHIRNSAIALSKQSKENNDELKRSIEKSNQAL